MMKNKIISASLFTLISLLVAAGIVLFSIFVLPFFRPFLNGMFNGIPMLIVGAILLLIFAASVITYNVCFFITTKDILSCSKCTTGFMYFIRSIVLLVILSTGYFGFVIKLSQMMNFLFSGILVLDFFVVSVAGLILLIKGGIEEGIIAALMSAPKAAASMVVLGGKCMGSIIDFFAGGSTEPDTDFPSFSVSNDKEIEKLRRENQMYSDRISKRSRQWERDQNSAFSFSTKEGIRSENDSDMRNIEINKRKIEELNSRR